MKSLLKKNLKEKPVRKGPVLAETGKYFKDHWQLYVLLAVPLAYIIIFKYIPMYGVQIAFTDPAI